MRKNLFSVVLLLYAQLNWAQLESHQPQRGGNVDRSKDPFAEVTKITVNTGNSAVTIVETPYAAQNTFGPTVVASIRPQNSISRQQSPATPATVITIKTEKSYEAPQAPTSYEYNQQNLYARQQQTPAPATVVTIKTEKSYDRPPRPALAATTSFNQQNAYDIQHSTAPATVLTIEIENAYESTQPTVLSAATSFSPQQLFNRAQPQAADQNSYERRQQSTAALRREPQSHENELFEGENRRSPSSNPNYNYDASEIDEIIASAADVATEQEQRRNSNTNQNSDISDDGSNSRRLCEIKYAEYIARIFGNDDDTTADANESEFNGRELATPGEYPHMTALGFEDKNGIVDYKCGGSLISDIFVITAAHCTNVTGAVPTKVRIGDWNLKVAEQLVQPVIQIRNIQRIFNHPRYESHMYYNDIALLQLSTSVDFTEFVRPIRLWVRPDLPFSVAYAMGYGATSFARAPTNHLTFFNISIVNNMQCNNKLPQMPETPRGILDSQICAQDFEKQRDTCQGDSGGPLQYNIHGRRRQERRHYHLIGITSFGFVCRSPYPGVYTRVFAFLDWIEGIVWNS